MLKKFLCSLILLVALSGCSVFRTPVPEDRILIRTEIDYRGVPDELLVCPPPPVVDPESLDSESDYNREFVLRLYNNNEICLESIRDVREYNKKLNELN